jgi:hypothetical protein
MIKRALIGHDLKIGTTHFHIEPKGPFDRCAMTRPCWRNFASEICGLKIRIMLGVARRALIINMRSYPEAGNRIAKSMVSLVTLITQHDILVNIHYKVQSTEDKSCVRRF